MNKRIAARPSRLSVSPPDARLTLVATLSIFLANAAAAISGLDQIWDTIGSWIDGSARSWGSRPTELFVSFMFCLAYACCCALLYRHFIRSFRAILKWTAIAALISGLPIVFAVSAGFVTKPVGYERVEGVAQEFSLKLAKQQNQADPNRGGFRFSTTELEGEAQPWTSAQVLVALEEWDRKHRQPPEKLRAGLLYLIQSRLPEGGWGYTQTSSPDVTEVDAWAVIALTRSLGNDLSPRLWSAQEELQVTDVVRAELNRLAANQLAAGGWSPLASCRDDRNLRNYSTLMAVWAFAEARTSPRFSAADIALWRRSANFGVQSLLRQAQRDQQVTGISTRAETPAKLGRYIGLNAQALFVLHRAAHAFPELALEGDVAKLSETYLRQLVAADRSDKWLSKRELDDNDRAHDSDRYLMACADRTAESSSFLWYPWVLTFAANLTDDRDANEAVRRDAHYVTRTLSRRIDEVSPFATGDGFAYPIAEMLIALSQVQSEQIN